jgi:hypothetical protein
VVYNASNRVRGPLVDLPPDDVKRAIEISAFGGFLVSAAGGQAHAAQVAWRHLPDRRHGGREGLCALGHLRHGQVRAARARAIDGARAVAQGHPCRPLRDRRRHPSRARPVPDNAPDSLLDPDAIAETYWATLKQHRSAWSWEIEVRPWVEKF